MARRYHRRRVGTRATGPAHDEHGTAGGATADNAVESVRLGRDGRDGVHHRNRPFQCLNHGNAPEPWERALDANGVRNAAREAVPNADDEDYDRARWLFGVGDLPNWTGHTLGYHVVGRVCEAMGARPSELITTPERDFVDALTALADG